MSNAPSRSLSGLALVWLLESLVAALWIYLLWRQRESTGLSLGLLGLGLSLAPLHALRLFTPQGVWTWASLAWEVFVLALVYLDSSSALPLGYVLALALCAAHPADTQPATHSGWRWLTRVPLALTLISIFALDLWPKPSLAALPWLLLGVESESGPAPGPRLALARASGALTLLALVSQVDLSIVMNRLVVLSFVYVALERYWHSDKQVLPQPSAHFWPPLRLLVLGLYCYALPDPVAVRIGCALLVAAGCLARWPHPPQRGIRIAALLVLVLAGLEVAAWSVRAETSRPLLRTRSHSLSLSDYLSELGAPKLRDPAPALRELSLRGQDYTLEWPSGYRVQNGHAPPQSSRAEVGSLVVVLGDEAAFGLGVGPNQHSSVRLRELLSSRRPTEVSNFGVIGANSALALGVARSLNKSLAPDEIVWLLRSDDLLPHQCQVPYETDQAWSVPLLRHLTAPAFERTYLGRLACAPYDALLRRLDLRTDYLGNVTAPESDLCYGFAARLHELCDLRRQQGRSTPIVLILPGHQPSTRQRAACLRLRNAGEAAGARVVEIPGFADDEQAWLEWAPHLPSVRGHAAIGAALAREIQPAS